MRKGQSGLQTALFLYKECEFVYRLVIAEKPSVAMSVAKVLGASGRKDGYMEGSDVLVSWCVGHLAGLAEPAVVF